MNGDIENVCSCCNHQMKKYEFKWRLEKVFLNGPEFMSTFPNSGDTRWTVKCTVERRLKSLTLDKYLVLTLSVDSKRKAKITADLKINIFSGDNFVKTANDVIFENEKSSWSMSEKLYSCLDDDGSVTVFCEIRELDWSPRIPGGPVPTCTTCNFIEDLDKMLSSGNFSDVTIECCDKMQLKAHRVMLAARSPVFNAMFSHDSLEAQSGHVVVSDVGSQGMAALLKFVYTGQVPLQLSELVETIVAADKYELPSLKTACERELVAKITVQNAASALALTAEKQQLVPFNENLLWFIKENIREIIETDGWKSLVLHCPHAVADLYEGRRRHLDDASDAGPSTSEAKRRCLETRKDTT